MTGLGRSRTQVTEAASRPTAHSTVSTTEHVHSGHSAAKRRAAADGRLLPYHFWWLAQTLLDEESQAAVAAYFEQQPVTAQN